MEYIEVLSVSPRDNHVVFYHGGSIGQTKDFEGYIHSLGNVKLCTYGFSEFLTSLSKEVVCASVYPGSPGFEKDSCYIDAKKCISAHIKAVGSCKLPLAEFYKFVPRSFLCRYFNEKGRLVRLFLSQNKKPKNYEHRLAIESLIGDIASRKVTLKHSVAHSERQKRILNMASSPVVIYNQNKAVTGRLSTSKGSFPIMTLAAKERNFIIPENDILIEFDFNAAEVRTLLALSGVQQPDRDIHEWNAHLLSPPGLTTSRKDAKLRFFSWLYDPSKMDSGLDKFYNKQVFTKYYSNGFVKTPFSRRIPSDKKHALNYLLQSTSSDLNLEQATKVRSILSEKKSYIKFLMHDSIVLDVAKEDLPLMSAILETFSQTRFGRFLVNVRKGFDFYNLEELKWKT